MNSNPNIDSATCRVDGCDDPSTYGVTLGLGVDEGIGAPPPAVIASQVIVYRSPRGGLCVPCAENMRRLLKGELQ